MGSWSGAAPGGAAAPPLIMLKVRQHPPPSITLSARPPPPSPSLPVLGPRDLLLPHALQGSDVEMMISPSDTCNDFNELNFTQRASWQREPGVGLLGGIWVMAAPTALPPHSAQRRPPLAPARRAP